MASSSPPLQNSDLEKQCEKLISNFCKEELIEEKMGSLTSLTHQVLPSIPLFEVEAVYLIKVIPKVCEAVLESLEKIASHVQSITNDHCENEPIIKEIYGHLKGVINCMECLESCTIHISKLAHNQLSISQIHSLHPGILKIILAAFNHCKESESLYKTYFQCFSDELSNLFKKTFQLQKALMEIIEKVMIGNNTDDNEAREMAGVCHGLLEISILIGDIDIGLLVNTWKALVRLVTKHKPIIKDDLEVDHFTSQLCESIKSRLSQCLSMATVKEGQSPEDSEFMDSIEAKSFTKMVRVVRFLMGILMQIVKEYCELLCGNVSELFNLLVILYCSLSPSLSAPPIISSALPEISSSVLIVIQPLLKVLVSNKAFAKCSTQISIINDNSINGYGLCRVILEIAAILTEQSDDVFSLWMNPTNFPEEEPCFNLFQAAMETFKRCALEINLPVYLDGIMCAGKPARKVSFYEHTVTHLSALIACCPASCFQLVEKCLISCLLGNDFLSALMAIDLWTFMARWESADLCYKHVNFLLVLVNNLPLQSSAYINVYLLVRRLACLMANEHQDKLLVSFPPSKSEYLLVWSVLPIKALSNNAQSKVCRAAVPVCIKQCSGSNMLPALLCLKSIYNIDNAQRLIPPVHHAAVVDIIVSLWGKLNQQTLQLHVNEDVWSEIVELTGIILPCIQPDHYARILPCLEKLVNQYKSVSLKVAIAQFLSRCGTKEVQPDFETGIFASISGLFSSLVSDRCWLVYQISLQSVKAFAEVTPYTHIMGDCVPERLLPSLSDFLSSAPYKQNELLADKHTWLEELLRSQLKDKEQEKDYRKTDKRHSNDDLSEANPQEPEKKRLKCDEPEITKDSAEYKEILRTLKSQVEALNNLRTKQPPNRPVLKELQDIQLLLLDFIETTKVSRNTLK